MKHNHWYFFLFFIFIVGQSLYSKGQTTFGTENIIIDYSTATDGAKSVIAADINNDGLLDVISASYYDNKIAYYLNLGNGNFDNQKIVSINAIGVNTITAADIDNDGNIDLFSASYDEFNFEVNKIAFYKNDGNANFSEETLV